MSENQKQEDVLEKEFLFWEETTQNISVITFSYEAYQHQKQLVESSRSDLLRNLDALKQTESNTREWDTLLKKTKDSLSDYKVNVKLLSK